MSRPWQERFWSKVDKHGPGGCWIWTAFLTRGYGHFTTTTDGHQVTKKAHRIAYELLVGPIPDGLCIDHVCRTRSCCNPEHLRPVTWRENIFAPGSKSIAVKHAEKTHCRHGHALVEGNLLRFGLAMGKRLCAECNKRRCKEKAKRRKAKAVQS